MKRFILLTLVAAFCVAATTRAQSSLLATLNHEGTITTFYGITALVDAHEAATHGDVISLSSGTFTSTNITKAITLRGAGMRTITVGEQTYDPTILSGNFTISIPDSATSLHLTMEGIYSNATVGYGGQIQFPSFLKCRFYKINGLNTSSTIRNANFIHCVVAYQIYLNSGSNATFTNCVLAFPSGPDTGATSEFNNCVITDGASYAASDIYYSTLKNCIIISSSTNSSLNNNNQNILNCVSNLSMMFSNAPNKTNTASVQTTSLFKTYTGGVIYKKDDETFELTDEAKTKYLGTDGTQVGIYGGNLPFDPTPSNPQITKFKVASKSTADGKLSVDIEVNAAE